MVGWLILIVILLIAINGHRLREKMCTKSNCTDRGFYTTADIDSIKDETLGRLPHLDYRHSYWDGVNRMSCDVCPNPYVCSAECPNNRIKAGIFNDPNKVRGLYEEIDIGVNELGHDPNSEYFTVANDPEFKGTRLQMGANTSRAGKKRGNPDSAEPLGISPEEKFVQGSCERKETTAFQLLYTGIMGLANPPPDSGDCEYLRTNGYLYKEPCELNEFVTQ